MCQSATLNLLWTWLTCYCFCAATHHIATSQTFNCFGRVSGFYADPNSCTHYFICVGGKNFGVDCATGLHFNPATKYCDWPANAHCRIQPGQVTAGITARPTTTQRPYTTHPFFFFTTTQRPLPTTHTQTRPNLGITHIWKELCSQFKIDTYIRCIFWHL